MPLRLARLVAAVFLTAAASAAVGVTRPAAATAAECSGPSGVNVVVDHGELGGGIDQVCNPSAGGNAVDLFTDAGFSLTYVQNQPGFVCRVNAVPLSDPCVSTPPADAYWGLWWSDGSSGSWSYATTGVGSLTVPDGGYVAFSWQSGSMSEPGVPATAHAGSPTPTPTPTATPSTGGDGAHGSASPKPTPKPHSTPSSSSATNADPPTSPPTLPPTPPPTLAPTTASSSSPADATQSTTPTPSVSEPGSPSTAVLPPTGSASASAEGLTDSAAPADDEALPIWVVPMVLLVLGVGGGAAVVVRHRRRLGH